MWPVRKTKTLSFAKNLLNTKNREHILQAINQFKIWRNKTLTLHVTEIITGNKKPLTLNQSVNLTKECNISTGRTGQGLILGSTQIVKQTFS